ncbi:MAG: phospholipase/carboxylesterase [Planctomycetota bacterium]|nr:MAG: phospholipase/carboxylesterase [Planctomycetota bacterium]
MALRRETLGGLTCRIISRLPEGTPPKLVVVLCHGFGAPGHDLVPIADELFDLCPALADSVEVIFPAAPLSLDELGMPGGRAWWHIDMNELIGAIEHGNLRILRDRRPEGIDEARDLLLGMLDEVQQKTGLPSRRFVLGGFSQGSMLAVEAALHWAEPPGGLCLWSSTLVSEAQWRANAARLKGLSIVQTHGRQDPILPFAAAIALRDLLIEVGANVNFLEFNGPHTITLPGLEALVELIERQLQD